MFSYILWISLFLACSCINYGDNGQGSVCYKNVTMLKIVPVSTREPYKVRRIRFCWNLPPRCSYYITEYKEVFHEEEQYVTEEVDFCCEGYVRQNEGQDCIPECEEQCQPYGTCIKPNVCFCNSGRTKATCTEEDDFQTSLAPSTAKEADSLTKYDLHLSENGTFNYEYFFDAETVSKIQVINDENENENEYENELFQESENIENELNWQKSILILRQYEETPESEITTGIAKPEITSQASNVSIPKEHEIEKENKNENENENEIPATTKSMRTSKANWFRPIYTSKSDDVAPESAFKTTEEESEMPISSSAISIPYYYDVEHETLEVTDDKEMSKFNSSKSALLNKVETTPRSVAKTNVTETDLANKPSSKNAKFKLNIIKTVESRITFDFEKILALGMKENVTVVELLEEKATPSSRFKIDLNVTSVSTLFNALGTQPLNRTINRKIETVPLFKKQNLTSEENEVERVDQLTTKAETNSLLVLNTATNDTDRKADSTKELFYEIRNVTLVAETSRMEPFGIRSILLIFLTIFLASFLMTCGCLIVMKVCVRRQLNSYSVKKLSIKDLNNEASIHLPFADDLPGTAGIRNLQNEVYDDLDDILKKLEGCSQTSDDFCSQCCPQGMSHKK